ncbi:hypothetical protein V6U90_05965 [Micromonospora sp. CPCC 206060]|uniref:hypothetical protein n=1 Tax=Micromonospora sp. CPCC 206060 TaxID=3122406 RepID=UPI002FF33B8A
MRRYARPVWLVLQQFLLLVATLAAGLAVGGLLGVLFGHERLWAPILGSVLFLPVFTIPSIVWSCREGPDEAGEPRWMVPLVGCLFAIVVPLLVGLPTLYEERFGKVVVGAVTEDRDRNYVPGTDQWIRAREAATDEDLGLLRVTVDRDLRVGDEVRVRTDPHDWFRSSDPDTRNPVLRRTLFWIGLTGVAGLVVLTSLRAVRDIRGWSEATRQPSRPLPTSRDEQRARDTGERRDAPDVEDVAELLDLGGDSGGSGGDFHGGGD